MTKQLSGFEMNIDKTLEEYLSKAAPEQLAEARKNAVIAMGMAWADQAKLITRAEGHIDTGLYINSIGYVTGNPATSDDVLYNLFHSGQLTRLEIGSNVHYAESLEKRYNIFGNALDSALPRMQAVAEFQVKKSLFG